MDEDIKARISRLESDMDEMRDFAPDKGRRHRDMIDRMIPSEVGRHLRASNRELLLAARAILDKVIERTEDREPEAPSKRIPVE
jgi:hypothetical protein